MFFWNACLLGFLGFHHSIFQKRFVSERLLIIFAPRIWKTNGQFFEIYSAIFCWIMCVANVNKNWSKTLLQNSRVVSLPSVSKILIVLLKEIENQPKSLKKFWLRNIRLVTLHSLKNRVAEWASKVMDYHPERSKGSQKFFESWEATATLILVAPGWEAR